MTGNYERDLVKRALALIGDGNNSRAAEAMGVSEGTIRRWRAGDFPVPLRSKTRAALTRYIAEREGGELEEAPTDELGHFLEFVNKTARAASGEGTGSAERKRRARTVLDGLLQMAEEDGNRPLMERIKADIARLGPIPPIEERPALPRSVDVLAFYDRESAAALERAAGMRHFARAAEIEAEETRARRVAVNLSSPLTQEERAAMAQSIRDLETVDAADRVALESTRSGAPSVQKGKRPADGSAQPDLPRKPK